MSTIIGYVQQNSPRSLSDGNEAMPSLNRRGELVAVSFYTQMAAEGRAYQIRLGTVTAPLEGDIDITDAKAEGAIDAGAGLIIIPVEAQWDIESLSGGTLPQCTLKAVGTVSSAGTAFVPLPLFLNGNSAKTGARATARVAAAGGCTVTAEAATTTLALHTQTLTVAGDVQALYAPVAPAWVGNDGCVYTQVGTVTAGAEYFAHINFIEMLASNIE